MAEIGSVTVAVSVEPTEEFDVVARALGYAKERTCRAEVLRCREDDGSQSACLVCSECGEKLRYREAAADDGEPDYELLPYCAGCGARVEGAGEMSYQEEQQPRTCGECEEFRRCCKCGGGWCMRLLEPVNEADEACEEPVFAPRMEGCSI